MIKVPGFVNRQFSEKIHPFDGYIFRDTSGAEQAGITFLVKISRNITAEQAGIAFLVKISRNITPHYLGNHKI